VPVSDTPGQVCYEGYCGRSGGISLISGDQLPPWEDLDPRVKEAWMAAAGLVLSRFGSTRDLRPAGDEGTEYR
jgi:hypothetical protein